MAVKLPQGVLDLRQSAQQTQRDGDHAKARELYEKYLTIVPHDYLMWTNLGAMLRAQGLPDMALAAQQRAYELAPQNEIIRNNLANILADCGQPSDALALRQEALRDTPDDATQLAMAGKVLRTLGRTGDAIDLLAKAQANNPQEVELSIQLALSQLAHGAYAEGFKTFERRWASDEATPRQMHKPKWDGRSLAGKTILVLPEQGLGDGIAMARFLPVLRGYDPARVMLATERPLLRLFDGMEGADWVGLAADAGDDFDVWTDMMDLPTAHFATSKDIPAPAPLTVPDAAKTRADQVLAPYPRSFNVGVVWAGSPTFRANANRSFSHTEFHRLLSIPNVRLFSLYKGPMTQAYRADGTAHLIPDTAATEADFADTAAMMQALDLVITSDTATAHLAGSLGVPVWLMLHWDAFWMWQLEPDRSPWYPSMVLYRQFTPRDWSRPFERAKTDLAALVASRKPGA